MEDTERQCAQRRSALESELSTAKTSLVKEVVRATHAALGDLMYSQGDVAEAFKHYLRTRDYCVGPEQTLQMCYK